MITCDVLVNGRIITWAQYACESKFLEGISSNVFRLEIEGLRIVICGDGDLTRAIAERIARHVYQCAMHPESARNAAN